MNTVSVRNERTIIHCEEYMTVYVHGGKVDVVGNGNVIVFGGEVTAMGKVSVYWAGGELLTDENVIVHDVRVEGLPRRCGAEGRDYGEGYGPEESGGQVNLV